MPPPERLRRGSATIDARGFAMAVGPEHRGAQRSIVVPTLGFGAVAATCALFTANPGLSAAAAGALVLVILLTWRPDEPPVLTFLCVIQWLQAAAKVLHADVVGRELHALPAAHHLGIAAAATIEQAALLSLGWVVALGCGVRLTRLGRGTAGEAGGAQAGMLSLRRLLWLYGLATALVLALGPIAGGRARQVVVALADLRWAVVFLVFWCVLRGKHSPLWLLVVFVAEVAAGFLSYFASFRVPVYLLAIAVASGPMLLRPRRVAAFAIVGALALYLGVLWSAVKVEYRDVLNRGTGSQVVAIDRTTQAKELLRLVGTVDRATLDSGFESLADRIGYIDYFAYALEHVPALQPHENGRLWRQALGHVVRPRVLFPDKAELESDTLIAERYTGLDLMSWTETTSVALGLAAEAYVDFGVPWMFLAAIWVGLAYGIALRVIAGRGTLPALRQALAVAALLPLATLELSTTKFFGGYLTRLIFAIVVVKTVLPPIGRWLLSTRAERPTPPRLRTVPAGSRLAREEHVPTR